MSLLQLINRPVTIIAREETGQIDEAGDEILDEVAIATVAEIQPRDSREPREHPDIADSEFVGFFLYEDAEHLDSAAIVHVPDEGDFEVVGAPARRRNPRTQIFEFVEIGLNRVAGPKDSVGS